MESTLNYDQLGEILSKVTSIKPTQEDLDRAYQLIKAYSKEPACIAGYLDHILKNSDTGCRQLAAVLMSKKITKHWETFQTEDKAKLTDTLIKIVQSEEQYPVAKAVSQSIYKLAYVSLVSEKWDILLDFIFKDPTQYSQNQGNLFEINLYIMAELLNSAYVQIQDLKKLDLIINILTVALKNGSQRMRENATKCVGNLVRNFDPTKIASLKSLIPFMFEQIEKFSDETVCHIYETFCDFHINSLGFFEEYFEQIVLVTYKLLDQEFLTNTKMVQVELIQMVSECKRKIFTANNNYLLSTGLELAFRLACTEDDTVYDSNEVCDFELGNRLLKIFSMSIQSKHVYPIVMQSVGKLLTTELRSSHFNRRAGIAALGVIVEGCEEKVRDDLEKTVDLLVNTFMTDESTMVKSSAIISLDALTEYFNDEMAEYHSKIMPMLSSGLKDGNPEETVEKCLVELNYFVRSLDFELESYIDLIVPSLLSIVLNNPSVRLQTDGLNALCSFISTGESKLASTIDVNSLVSTCQGIISRRLKDEEKELRANALKCAGEIAVLVGEEKFSQYLKGFSECALEFVMSKDYNLVNAGFNYFGSVSKILKYKISDDLNKLVGLSLETIKDESGIEKQGVKDEYGLDSDSEVEDGKVVNDNGVTVDEDFIDAKCSAIHSLCQFCMACPKTFIQNNYIDEIIKVFELMWDNVDENVNYELVSAYESLVCALYKEDPHIAKTLWNKVVFFNYEKALQDADDRALVVKIFESIYNVIDEIGKEIFLFDSQPTNCLQRILEMIKKLLEKKLDCQIKGADDDEEDEDSEEKLLLSAVNVLLILAERLCNEFHPILAELSPLLNKYLSTKRSEYDRSIIFGCYADCLKYSTVSTKFFIDGLFSHINSNLSKINKNQDDTHRSICYLVGILFESDPEISKPRLSEAINIISTCYSKADKLGKENAAAAYARICLSQRIDVKSDDFKKILEIILPLIPFVNDPVENLTMMDFFEYFIQNVQDIELFKQTLAKILEVTKYILLHQKKCETEDKHVSKAKAIIHSITQNNEDVKKTVESFIVSLPDHERDQFIKLVN